MASSHIMQINDIVAKLIPQNELDSIQIIPLSYGGDNGHFLTTIYKIILKLQSGNKELLSKFVSCNDRLVKDMDQIKMFYNEILFYKEYVPLLPCESKSIVPEFYFGRRGCDQVKHCVFVEFLSKFRLSKSTMFLPREEIESTLKSLGVLHGLGYFFKEDNPKAFVKICDQIEEIRYHKCSEKNFESLEQYNRFERVCIERIFDQPELKIYSEDLLDNYKRVILKDHTNFKYNQMSPKDNLAVVCHGDVTRNNILFHKDTLESKLIDFQLFRYAQPTTDLALFLGLHLDPTEREVNFDKYLRIYHNTVISTLEKYLTNIDYSKYSYDNFVRDYANHSFIGFAITSFFLPMMSDVSEDKFERYDRLDEFKTEESMLGYLIEIDFASPKILGCIARLLRHCIDQHQRFGDDELFQ